MKKIFLFLALAISLHAQSCVSIVDTLYAIGPAGPVLANGSIFIQMGNFISDGSFRIVQSVTTLNIVSGAIATCLPPSIYKATYTIKNTQAPYSTYWFIPNNVSGPYQLTSVPSGFVNTTGTSVAWVSGIDFANVALTDLPVIAGISYAISSIQGVTQLTLKTSAGSQAGVSFTDGPIERAIVNPPIPLTISGPPGPPGAILSNTVVLNSTQQLSLQTVPAILATPASNQIVYPLLIVAQQVNATTTTGDEELQIGYGTIDSFFSVSSFFFLPGDGAASAINSLIFEFGILNGNPVSNYAGKPLIGFSDALVTQPDGPSGNMYITTYYVLVQVGT